MGKWILVKSKYLDLVDLDLIYLNFLERELSKSYEASIKWLQKDLYESKREVTKVESNMVGALVNSMDVIKRQAALSK
ncbi:hypothetical protein JHK87_047506 [Glycine soja]|nr:hypothetical protein JHK87_047506 [Glycine soja]